MVSLIAAFLIGLIAGLRALVAPAAVSWAAQLGWINLSTTPLAFVGYMWDALRLHRPRNRRACDRHVAVLPQPDGARTVWGAHRQWSLLWSGYRCCRWLARSRIDRGRDWRSTWNPWWRCDTDAPCRGIRQGYAGRPRRGCRGDRRGARDCANRRRLGASLALAHLGRTYGPSLGTNTAIERNAKVRGQSTDGRLAQRYSGLQ